MSTIPVLQKIVKDAIQGRGRKSDQHLRDTKSLERNEFIKENIERVTSCSIIYISSNSNRGERVTKINKDRKKTVKQQNHRHLRTTLSNNLKCN